MEASGTSCQSQAWPFYPLAFLHDIARCLAMADQGVLQLNPQNRLQMSSVARLAAASMVRPEYRRPLSEAQAPGLSFLVGLLGSGGLIGVVADGPASKALRMSPAGHEWLARPSHRQVEQLRQMWWLDPLTATRALARARYRRRLDGHWRQVTLETAAWIAALPEDAWSPLTDLTAHLAARGLTSAGASANLPRVQQSFERQSTAFGLLLAEVVLPRLGLVEIRRLAGKGMEVRAMAEGSVWLRAALSRSELLQRPTQDAGVELTIDSTDLRFPVSCDPAMRIEPGLELVVSLAAPALCTFEISHVAELVSPGPPARYKLTRDSLRQALTWGYPVPEVLFLLAQFSNGRVPQAVLAQIEAWQEEMAVVGCEPGYRLSFAAPELLSVLRKRDPFRQRTVPLASGQDVWVAEARSPELFRYLRRVGYELEGRGGTADSRNGSEPIRLALPFSHSAALPLAQLLVILRTYQHLRRLVPGLADVDIGPLDRAVAAVLAPDDLAGAERLAASHLIFLRHHLRRAPQDDGAALGEGEAYAEDGDSRQGERDGPARDGRQDAQGAQKQDAGRPENDPGREACAPLARVAERLQAAIEARISVELTYAAGGGTTSCRRVRPLHLETRWGRRYLLAYCELRQDERHFRLDRIVAIEE